MLVHRCEGHPTNKLWTEVLFDPARGVFRLILENTIVVEVDGVSYQMITGLNHFCLQAGAHFSHVAQKLLRDHKFLVEFLPPGQKEHYLVFACLYEVEAFLERDDWYEVSKRVYHQYMVQTAGRVMQPQGFPVRVHVQGQRQIFSPPHPMIGSLAEIREVIERVATTDVPVLITGETGVGKELVARFIHEESNRKNSPFLKRNCAAMPRELLESELFGHERGAFTGADRQHEGAFAQAQNGTIFLDEIGEMHPALQAKILHVLQDGEFCPVGGKKTQFADVRIVAATNRDLAREIQANRFREDLFYRLNVVQIHVPALRERKEDIPILVDYFVHLISGRFNLPVPHVSPDILALLINYSWPGNVRELENILKRAIVLRDFNRIIAVSLQQHISGHKVVSDTESGPVVSRDDPTSLKEISRRAVQEAERRVIEAVLKTHRWNRVRTAKALKISYRALLYKIREMKLRQDTVDSGSMEALLPREAQKTVRTPETVFVSPEPEPLKSSEGGKLRTRKEEVIEALHVYNWNRIKAAKRLGILAESVGAYMSMYNIRPFEKEWLEKKIAEGIRFEDLRVLMDIKALSLEKLLNYHKLVLLRQNSSH